MWGVGIGAAIVVALVVAHRAAVNEAFARGRKTATDGVAFDSAMLARASEVITIRTQHTDTVTRNVIKTRWKIDTLIVQLPPAVADVPEVQALVVAVNTLTVQVDSLTTAHAAERMAWTEQQKVNAAAIYALRVIGTAQRDTIVQLQKRPTRLRAFTYAVAAGALGVVAGVVR